MGIFGNRKGGSGGERVSVDDTRLAMLANTCEGSSTNQSFREFWKEMFLHPEWHFLNDPSDVAASLDAGRLPSAMAGVREPSTNRLAIAVFSSAERANAYHNATKGGGGASTATLTTCMSARNAVEYLAQQGDEVSGLIVNYDGRSFAPSLSLEQLVTNYEFDTGDLPEGAWPRFTSGVQFANADIAWDRLYAQLVKLPVWTTLTFASSPTKPVTHMQGEDVLLVMYTHRRYAEFAGAHGRIPGSDAPGMGDAEGNVALCMNDVTPAEMMEHMRQFAAHLRGQGRRLGVLFNAGVAPFGLSDGAMFEAWEKNAG